MQIDYLLKQVEKPSRYIGGEVNTINKEISEDTVRFGFAFPDVYEIGMSFMGLQILYFLLNDMDDVFCERLFSPWTDMEKIMRETDTPLFTMESRTPAGDLDIIGFTLQYEMSYSNIVNMLDLSGLPVFALDRDESHPLIIAGGPCAFNPEPIADFIDVVFIGDSENILPEFIERFKAHKAEKTTKREFLKNIVDIPGIYIPSFYEATYEDGIFVGIKPIEKAAPAIIKKNMILDLNKAYFPSKQIVPYADAVHDRAVIEIFRGCTRGCRFCHAGMVYRPVRERSIDTISEIVDNIIKNTGYEELSLASLSTSDYSNLGGLVEKLLSRYEKERVGISLPSLRLDSFSIEILQRIQSVRKTGLTFAPEAGSQRLRDVINKGIEENDLLESVENAFNLGWDSVKLYFMIGRPTETEEDLDGIYELAKKDLETYYKMPKEKRRRKPRITVSVSNFVPKAFTPFQWARQDEPSVFMEKHRYLSKMFRKEKTIQFNYHDADTSFMESVFSRGDRRLSEVIYKAWNSGCKFDSWNEYFDYDKWIAAMKDSGLDPIAYANRFSDYKQALSWDHISAGIEKQFLASENEKAKIGELTPDCRQGCCNCGISKDYRGACDV